MKTISNSLLKQPREDLVQELRMAQYQLGIAEVSGSKIEIQNAYDREVIADSNLAFYDELKSHETTYATNLH